MQAVLIKMASINSLPCAYSYSKDFENNHRLQPSEQSSFQMTDLRHRDANVSEVTQLPSGDLGSEIQALH